MTEPGSIAVIGAGGHGKVVVGTLLAAGLRVAAVYDDDRRRHGQALLGVESAGPSAALAEAGDRRAVIADGDNRARHRLADRLAELELEWPVVRHPFSWVDPSARLGAGTVVCAGAVVQPEAELGRHAIVNTGASIDHDCVLGDFVHVAPGARLAGGVTAGRGVLFGAGSVVAPGIGLGEWAVVGAGAAAVADVPAGAVVKGVPAR